MSHLLRTHAAHPDDSYLPLCRPNMRARFGNIVAALNATCVRCQHLLRIAALTPATTEDTAMPRSYISIDGCRECPMVSDRDSLFPSCGHPSMGSDGCLFDDAGNDDHPSGDIVPAAPPSWCPLREATLTLRLEIDVSH